MPFRLVVPPKSTTCGSSAVTGDQVKGVEVSRLTELFLVSFLLLGMLVPYGKVQRTPPEESCVVFCTCMFMNLIVCLLLKWTLFTTLILQSLTAFVNKVDSNASLRKF